MHILLPKNIWVERLGQRVVRVDCTQCGCQYCFTLIRIGVGSAWATRDSLKEAEADLEQRLETDTEPVPCPACHWINEDLIRGYRQGRYRSLGNVALAFTILGALPLIVLCWLIWDDPATSRRLWPYFVGQILGFWLVAVCMIFLRNSLRSRIQPNRNYPLAPETIPGLPTAFVIDLATKQLTRATPSEAAENAARGPIGFRLGSDDLPTKCCDCLEEAAPGCEHPVRVTKTMNLGIPKCASCARRTRFKYWRAYLISWLVGALVTGAVVLLSVGMDSPKAWFIGFGGLLIELVLAPWLASMIAAPVKISGLDLPRGTFQMRFRHPKYAELVARHLRSLWSVRNQ